MKKKWLTALLCVAMTASLMAGCGSKEEPAPEIPAAEETPEAEVPEETAEEETPEAKDKVMLVVSFGTSYNDSRDKTIGAIENALAEAYPDYEVRRAFTSQIIIDKLKERDGLEIDNVEEAMKRLVADGVKEVIVQPTHVMPGFEYNDVVDEVKPYETMFDSLIVGQPLLSEDADFEPLVKILAEETKEYNTEDTAVVWMGHGTEHDANETYTKLQETFKAAGYDNYIVGTVEAEPTLEDVIAAAKELGVKKLVLSPLMIVAGDHANNDMAGEEEDSWKSILTKEGFEVECVLRGMGEYKGVQQMFADHVKKAMNPAAPLYAENIKEGTYPINVSSSSSMFRVVDAQLTVKDGAMSVVLTLSGQGYEKLYVGTSEEALADSDDKCAYFVENEEGLYTYEIPVEALNVDADVCAWSIKKQQWYDRVLVYQSDLIPEEALISK